MENEIEKSKLGGMNYPEKSITKTDVDLVIESEVAEVKASGAGVLKTVVNMICTMVGVGILGLPTAVAITGYGVGIAFMLVGCVFASYCAYLLSRCMSHGNKQRVMLSFEELGLFAGGRFGMYCAIITSYGTCWAASVLMLILATSMFKVLVGDHVMHDVLWTLIAAIMITPFTYLKTMGHVAYVSVFGMIASLLVFFVVLGQDIQHIASHGPSQNAFASDSRDFQELSNAFVTMVFSFGGACVFPELQRVMKRPTQFPT
eukprot:Sdes_comp23825_c0_seq1m21973